MNGKAWLLAAAGVAAAAGVVCVYAQEAEHVGEPGAHPPGPPGDRTVAPYAGEPADMSPTRSSPRPTTSIAPIPTSTPAQPETFPGRRI